MGKTIKIYRHNKKSGELKTSRTKWDGDFPTDHKGFEKNGYRRITVAGDELSAVYDVYTNGKDWLIDIYLFGEHLACIKIADPILLLKTVDQISQSSASISKAIELAN